MHKQNSPSSYSSILHTKFSQIVSSLTDNPSIPTPIRTAFKATCQILESHRTSFEFLQKSLPLKASKQQLHQLLAQKVSVVDLSTALGTVNDMMERKVNVKDFNTMLQESELSCEVERKVGRVVGDSRREVELMGCAVRDLADHLQRVQNDEQKAKARIEEAVRILSTAIGDTNQKVTLIDKQLENMHKLKESIDEGSLQISKLRQDVKKQIQQTSLKISTLATSPSTKNIDSELKQTIIQSICKIKQACQQNEKEIKKFNKGLRKKEFDGIQQVLMKAIDQLRSEFQGIVQEKTESIKINMSEADIQKTVIKVLKEYSWLTRQQFTKQMMQLELNMNTKPSLQEVKLAFKAFQQDILFSIDSIRGEFNKRMDNEAISRSRQPIQIQRPSIKSRDIGKYITIDEFRKYQQDQMIIQQNVCYENIVGRWSWKGAPSSDRVVSWEVEMINTLPDNFIWVAGSHYIKIKNSGLYYIVMGVFSDSQQIQAALYMNDTQLSQLNVEDQEPNEQVARSVSQYVYLKENSRISVYYQGSKNTQGFISIKRL